MATELVILLLAVLLAFAHLSVYAVVGNLQLGIGYTLGPRDAPPAGLSVQGQRLKRSYENYLETLPWFAIAMVVAHLSGKADATTHLCGWGYLAARIAYIPAYVAGVPVVRSALWTVAAATILIITLRALL